MSTVWYWQMIFIGFCLNFDIQYLMLRVQSSNVLFAPYWQTVYFWNGWLINIFISRHLKLALAESKVDQFNWLVLSVLFLYHGFQTAIGISSDLNKWGLLRLCKNGRITIGSDCCMINETKRRQISIVSYQLANNPINAWWFHVDKFAKTNLSHRAATGSGTFILLFIDISTSTTTSDHSPSPWSAVRTSKPFKEKR